MDQSGWMIDVYDVPGHKVKSRPQARQAVRLYAPDRAPRVWLTWMQGFGASAGLGQRLWRVFLDAHSGEALGRIIRAQRRADKASVQAMLQAVTPGRMLALTAMLSPEGAPREKEVRALEEKIVEAARSPERWR